MEQTAIFLLMPALAVQTAPLALGMMKQSNGLPHLSLRLLIIALVQTLMLYFGILTGNRFMYLLVDLRAPVLFAAFFLIAIRYFLEIFKIRKGERTYNIKNDFEIIIPSVAISINTFLTGILLFYTDYQLKTILGEIFIFSFVFGILFSLLPFAKRSFGIISLLYLVSGVVFITISIFFAFF